MIKQLSTTNAQSSKTAIAIPKYNIGYISHVTGLAHYCVVRSEGDSSSSAASSPTIMKSARSMALM